VPIAYLYVMDSITEITTKLDNSFQDVSAWIKAQEDQRFILGPEGKWKTSGHLDHLTQTAEMVVKGLRMPKLVLRWKFGKTNRPIRSYDEVAQRYNERLSKVPAGVTSPMTIRDFSIKEKSKCVDAFEQAGKKLSETAVKWSDKKLDAVLLPHPLMGRMPVRELLMWTSYHNYHHLRILKEKY